MIYPAWFDLYSDKAITDHPTALRLYGRILHGPQGPNAKMTLTEALRQILFRFTVPQELKIVGVAEELGVHPDSIRMGLHLLISRGYVEDCGKGYRGMCSVILRLERTDITCPPNQVHQAA